jgi:hypothetical protein
MTLQELLELSIANFKTENLHPLHQAILEECCENALNNKQGVIDKDTLIYSVRIAFITSNSMLKGMLRAALLKADFVNLNYRGLSFEISKDSPIIQELKK